MDADELAFAGVARQLELLGSGEVTSRQLTELYLDRIDRLDGDLNAFRIVFGERALADAEQADARRAAGEQRSLLGLPIALKDNMEQAGEVNPNGTGAYGAPEAADAEMIRRLREAGCVFLGRALCPELSIVGATESPTWGVTRNPWDLERTPGGSSGGSAAAVAAGLAPAATASDGAGSIRIPAANCGLFGLKPQRGRVSTMPHAEHWNGLSVFGFVTRSVLDSALLHDAVNGAIEGDAHHAPAPPRPFAESARSDPGKLRIALSYKPPFPVPVDGEVRRAIEDVASALERLGHTVARADPPLPLAAPNAATIRYLRGVAEDVAAVPRPQRLSRRTRSFGRTGSLIPDAAFEWARGVERAHSARINEVFDAHDVVLTPQTARPPASATAWEGMSAIRAVLGMLPYYPFTVAWNVTGQPAASVPAGLTSGGLPVAAQLIGRENDEGTLLALAAQLERERPWAQRRPPHS